ncbi:MAG: S26 family signal peptidase, partial [Thermoplasmatota archaeon]
MSQEPRGNWKDRLKDSSPRLHRFLTSDEKPFPLARELTAGALVVLFVLSALWLGTGQSLDEAPVVVIESGSMMHCVRTADDRCAPNSFGRLGTIDPGDLVFVRDVDGKSDIRTYSQGGKERHGEPGDVIIFKPGGSESRTPIIHRAMFWLEVHDDGTFSVPELGLDRVDNLNQPVLVGPDSEYRLPRGYADTLRANMERDGVSASMASGFITRGDNNPNTDQTTISAYPIHPDWVIGKARGEVPWLGLIKLWFTDFSKPDCAANTFSPERAPGYCNYANAPQDLHNMLWWSLIVIVGAPLLIDLVV